MKLLRFGETTINIDRVIRIDDRGSSISVDFVPHDGGSRSVNMQFEGEEAAALRRWLLANAEDMAQLDEHSTGEPLNDPHPYISPR